MMLSMSNKNDMDSGIPLIRMAKDLSHLSLKSNVYQPVVSYLRDGRKVSLRPELMKAK
jgi:hypothetical protein